MENSIPNFFISVLIAMPISLPTSSQPVPGDIFRDYVWIPDMVLEEEKFLRVGGHFNYITYSEYFPSNSHKDGHIIFDKSIDLDMASKAELVVEVVCSHGGTTGLKIQINKDQWHALPPPKNIPLPRENYMYHTNITVPLPLNQLHPGDSNTFKMEVHEEHPDDWPQNLVYGIILRIYYTPDKDHPAGKLDVVSSGAESTQAINMKYTPVNAEGIKSVDFIAKYEDINWEGDGQYEQWHYHYHKGQIRHHVHHLEQAPFRYQWALEWVPDQENPIQLGALVTDQNDIRYFLPRQVNLKLKRKKFSVELYKPFDQPENWVTREEQFEEKIGVEENLENAITARLYWTSWSPCYSNGIYINDHLVFMREDPCYTYFAHEVEIPDLRVFHMGENIISTGKIPLFQGQMVHGMEVQWPGIMVKIQYED